MSLEFTGELCVMTMENDAKTEEELSCKFKIYMKNLTNLHFNGLLLNKVYNVWAKKSIREFCLIAQNIDATFEGKLTCVFKKNMRNLANFHQSMFESLKSGTLMGSFYSK